MGLNHDESHRHLISKLRQKSIFLAACGMFLCPRFFVLCTHSAGLFLKIATVLALQPSSHRIEDSVASVATVQHGLVDSPNCLEDGRKHPLEKPHPLRNCYPIEKLRIKSFRTDDGNMFDHPTKRFLDIMLLR